MLGDGGTAARAIGIKQNLPDDLSIPDFLQRVLGPYE
jgi:hypothetical protein